MKKIILSLLSLAFLTSCSAIQVYPARHFVDLTKDDLSKKAKAAYVESGMDDFVPNDKDKNSYYSSLESSIAYRNYLFLECLMLLQKEHNLDLKKPVYASHPKWNNVSNWYYSIFNFQGEVNHVPTELTMSCDLAVNKSKEVTEYQLKKIFAELDKND